MKTIKSVLIGALVALLGSSAWAATYDVNLQIGGVTNIQFATTTSSPSWAINTAGDESVATFTLGGTRNREATITGVGVGDTTWTVQRNSTTHTFNVHVIEPSFVDYGMKPLMLKPNTKSADITVTSMAAADWTIWSENEDAATVSLKSVSNAKSATFAITAGGEEDSAICIASNKYAKYAFNVTVNGRTDVSNVVVNCTREVRKATSRRAAPAKAHWIAWSTDSEMVTVALSHDERHDEPTMALLSSGSAKNPDSEYDGMYVKIEMVNTLKKSGVAYVYVENDQEPNKLYSYKVVCDVATSTSITLKHSPDGTDPQSWFDIDPEEFPGLKPLNDDEAAHWGLDRAYSDNKNIAAIKVVDDKFRIYNPAGADGRDGETRVIFIPSEEDALAGGKIWIFYVSVSTVEVEKFLTFKDESKKDSEATLNIRTHYLNNVTEEYTNKVLFVGTGCSSHDLEKDTFIDSVYVIAQKANVDVYMPSPTDNGESILGKKIAITKGLSKEQVSTALNLGSGDFPSNNHSTMEGFYGLFYQLAMDEKMRYYYDYIVMEFDCQRIAAYKNSGGQDAYVFDKTRDTVVAEWLNEYYEGTKNSPTARVVWVVDDEIGANDGSGFLRNESEENFFRPFQRHITGSGSTENNTETSGISDNRFRALLGLLNPWLYLEYDLYAATDAVDLANRLDSCCGTYDYRIGASDPGTLCENTRVGEKYEHQAYYNNKTGLTNFLSTHFETTVYAARITDNVETQGLSIVEGTLKMYGAYETNTVGNTDIEDWTEIKATVQPGMSVTGAVDYADHSITGETGNIVREFWTWIAVDLKDDASASFRHGAKYNEDLGAYLRDPNLNTNFVGGVLADTTNGEAAVAYFYDTLKPDDGVYGWATTLWDWEFDSLPIKLDSKGVNRMYDGTSTNATYTVDPSDATIKVSYSNDVEKIWTAFETYDEDKFTDCTNVWARFVATKEGYLSATSESQVVISPLPVTVTLVGSTNKYDAAGHTVTVNVDPKQDIGDSSRKTELSFSSSVDPTWSDWFAYSDNSYKSALPAFTNCGTYTVYAKVRNLPNYTNDITVSADVVITQRTITVTATAASKDYSGVPGTDPTFAFTWDGDYVPSEEGWIQGQLENSGGITRILSGEKAGTYANALSSNSVFSAGQNYIVNFTPGTFTINPGQLQLTLTPSTTTYDGEEHTIGVEINVTNDLDSAREIAVRFSTDGSSWTKWTDFEDLDSVLPKGTNVADSTMIYVQATNILKTSLFTFSAPTPVFTANVNGNYKWKSGSAVLTITKRPITLKSPTKSCDYDDVPLTFDGTEISAGIPKGEKVGGYVTGETFAYSNFAVNNTPGTSKSATFDYADASALANNYKVNKTLGKLTVRAKPTPPPSGCTPQVDPKKDIAWVYKWKFIGKTTEGVLKVTEAIPVGCLVGGIPSQMEAIRVPASLKIQGYTVKCNPTCLDVEEAAFVGNSKQEGEAFWISKPTKGAFVDDADGNGVAGVSFRFGNVIGRSAGKYEVVGAFKGMESVANELYELRFAGQGNYTSSKLRVSTMSGSFAGRMIVPHYHKYVAELHGCPKATVWDCMGLTFLDIDGRESTAAYGKWSMTYNATASSDFAKGKGRPETKYGAKWLYRK